MSLVTSDELVIQSQSLNSSGTAKVSASIQINAPAVQLPCMTDLAGTQGIVPNMDIKVPSDTNKPSASDIPKPEVKKEEPAAGDSVIERFAKSRGIRPSDKHKVRNEIISVLIIVALIPFLDACIDILQEYTLTHVWNMQTLWLMISFSIAPSILGIFRGLYAKEAQDLRVEMEEMKEEHQNEIERMRIAADTKQRC
jgi:hypothetical protein